MNIGGIAVLFIIVYCLFRIHYLNDFKKYNSHENIAKYSLLFIFLVIFFSWVVLSFGDKNTIIQHGGADIKKSKAKIINEKMIKAVKGRKINMVFQVIFGIALFLVLSFSECYSTLLIFFVGLIILIYMHKKRGKKYLVFTERQLMEDGVLNHSKFAITDIFGIFVTQYTSDETSRSIVDYTILYMLLGITIIRLMVLRQKECGDLLGDCEDKKG